MGTVSRAPDFGQPILPVGDLPADGIPKNGEEYLAMVQHEASLQPRILSKAGLTQPYAPTPPTQPQAVSVSLMPTSAWCTVFLERMHRLHYSLRTPIPDRYVRLSIPCAQDETAWYVWVHGRDPPNEEERLHMLERAKARDEASTDPCDTVTQGDDSEGEVSGILDVSYGDILEEFGYVFREPTFRSLQSLDTDDAMAITKMFRKWIQHPQFTQQAGASMAIHPIHARWIFGILAQLDRRLSSDDIAALRTLARVCMKCIARLRHQVDYLYDENTNTLEAEMGAWMIITVIAGVWGQQDLWKEAQARVGARP